MASSRFKVEGQWGLGSCLLGDKDIGAPPSVASTDTAHIVPGRPDQISLANMILHLIDIDGYQCTLVRLWGPGHLVSCLSTVSVCIKQPRRRFL